MPIMDPSFATKDDPGRRAFWNQIEVNPVAREGDVMVEVYGVTPLAVGEHAGER